ncbi:helix-turn-helix domain-containing protein [Kitasatospora sp. NPDC088391]|uniref:helix-turn-helix domain-containing protein n=1 Tax=Kitasatospora sp. NPDC088391 TaxID=3364074 RepID=UPI003818DC98
MDGGTDGGTDGTVGGVADGADGFVRLVAGRTADPEVLAAAVRAARAASGLVAGLPEGEVRRHTRALLDGVRTALEAGGAVDAGVLAAAALLGSDRARQGVPVAALLDGFQAGRVHLVESVVAEGRRAGVPADRLLDGVTRIDRITTALARRMVQAHREAELESARTAREGAVLALRQLLHGEAVQALPEVLSAAGRYHCVVTAVGDPASAGPLERALSAAGPGLCGFVDGRLTALVAAGPGAFASGTFASGPSVAGVPGPGAYGSEAAGPSASAVLPPDGPLAVVTPAAPPDGLAPLYGLAREALRAAEEAGLAGPHRLADLALLTAAPTGPGGLGAVLAAELLGGLDRSDAFHRELAATALAHLAHGGGPERTAAVLHVHANTVKYRLRRLRELTGADPFAGGVERAAHWWWALRCWLAGPS